MRAQDVFNKLGIVKTVLNSVYVEKMDVKDHPSKTKSQCSLHKIISFGVRESMRTKNLLSLFRSSSGYDAKIPSVHMLNKEAA